MGLIVKAVAELVTEALEVQSAVYQRYSAEIKLSLQAFFLQFYHTVHPPMTRS